MPRKSSKYEFDEIPQFALQSSANKTQVRMPSYLQYTAERRYQNLLEKKLAAKEEELRVSKVKAGTEMIWKNYPVHQVLGAVLGGSSATVMLDGRDYSSGRLLEDTDNPCQKELDRVLNHAKKADANKYDVSAAMDKLSKCVDREQGYFRKPILDQNDDDEN